jgi:hypothetical protein
VPVDEILADPAYPDFIGDVLEFAAKGIQGLSFVTCAHRLHTEGSAFFRLEDYQKAAIMFKPDRMITVLPDKEVGEGQFRNLRRVFGKVTPEQVFVFNLQGFEFMRHNFILP